MSTLDPGMGEPIEQAAKDVEADEEAEEEEQEFMDPGRWWFASTACPLLAGTFGPMANMFSICALVQEWRVYIPPADGTEEHGVKIPDPKWLIAINAISLAAALIGNASLLLNMAKRIKFSIAQPITIAGFFLAGVLLIADMAALASSPTYFLSGDAAPASAHALTSAFYYAIFATLLYLMIALLMCLTVYGAQKDYYSKDFNLTPSQRTLMLQTMMFFAYILLGALVFSSVEQWEYLDAIYWADVTVLTVGLGDYSPSTDLGRGLLIPFAICGIMIIGLVIGSIRTLVLERGKEKLAARITEKRREGAIHNVDERKQTIKISFFTAADFSTDPSLSPAQRREEEFAVMRKVQDASDSEQRWFALATSTVLGCLLWFVGAAIFMVAERNQQWTYFESLYFTYVCLLTIGYGDLHPMSNSGRAFFVFWSLLAVPSLTILISNLGDTVIIAFSDLTTWVGSITVLPGEQGFRASTKAVLQTVTTLMQQSVSRFSFPGLFGDSSPGHPMQHEKRMNATDHENRVLDRLAERLSGHVDEHEHEAATRDAQATSTNGRDEVEDDMNFYHYILAREARDLMKDLGASPPKKYEWVEWEYFLKLMGNDDDVESFPGQKMPNVLVPEPMKEVPSTGSDATMTDGAVDRETERKRWKEAHRSHKGSSDRTSRRRRDTYMDLRDWSWLSNKSPLMGTKSESEWILERLSAALERELNRQRKGCRRKPPISLSDIRRRKDNEGGDAAAKKEASHVEKAARS